jgi:hypothetical protein
MQHDEEAAKGNEGEERREGGESEGGEEDECRWMQICLSREEAAWA